MTMGPSEIRQVKAANGAAGMGPVLCHLFFWHGGGSWKKRGGYTVAPNAVSFVRGLTHWGERHGGRGRGVGWKSSVEDVSATWG